MLDIRQNIEKVIKNALNTLSIETESVSLEHPEDMSRGDYSTNIALALAKKNNKKPIDLAKAIVVELQKEKIDYIETVEVAGAGFINFKLSRDFFTKNIEDILKKGNDFGKTTLLSGEKIMIEYTDPNPFKEMHIGHLMSNTTGESLARTMEWNGGEVKRANYQGDVGLHIGKAIWGMKKLQNERPDDSASLSIKSQFLGKAYADGANAYEDNEHVKKEIQDINKAVYDKSDVEINKLYEWGRKVSLEHFEIIYKKLGTKFDFYFFESEMASMGLFLVEEFLAKGIFEKSNGAVVFPGEKYGLHTRVFINSQGLPTYEAKDLGLNKRKPEVYPYSRSIIVTANEQTDYFKVLIKAMEFVYPEIANKTRHISHGMLRFASGKMSSRKGNVISAESLVSDVEKMVLEKMKDRELGETQKKEIAEIVAVGAIKYSILKQAVGGDIVYDFEKSVSFEGDSGPYLQYAHTRALSVLSKAEKEGVRVGVGEPDAEVSIVEKILYQFPEVVERAGREYSPHYIATYLVALAGAFNSFYANMQIVNAGAKAPYRVALTQAVATVLRNGLDVLGIRVPEKM